MDVDEPMELPCDAVDQPMVPMPETSGIEALREKLHARMAQLRRGPKVGGDGEAGSRDELLEERRKQRAAMRERRRKETKEKIRREEEMRGKKAKDKEQSRDKGPSTKVCPPYLTTQLRWFTKCRHNCSSRRRALHSNPVNRRTQKPNIPASHIPPSQVPLAAVARKPHT